MLVLNKSGESIPCDEGNFINWSKIIPKLFDSTKHNDIVDSKIWLIEMKIQFPEKITVGHLNINSVNSKFDALVLIIDTNKDIWFISETMDENRYSFLSV